MKYLKILLVLFIMLMLASCTPKYDLSTIVFEDKTVNYDGRDHMIYVSGDIPEGVDVRYNFSGAIIEVGEYQIIATFTAKNQLIGEKTAKLTILPAQDLNIFMKDQTVVYDGKPHTINPEGDLPADLVILRQDKYTDAGVYQVTCEIQSESVFIPFDQRTLTATLTIEKAVFDTSALEFSENEFVYDYSWHSIDLLSVLPPDVSIFYENNQQQEIGTYDVIVTFDVGNNYIQPEPLHLQLIINKPADWFEITFIDGDNQYTRYMKKGQEFYPPSPTNVPGYLVSWDNDFTQITGDTVVNRTLFLLEYKLGVDWGSATPYELPELIRVETPEISLPNPQTKEGVYFEGWFTSPTFEESTRITSVPAGIGKDGHFNIYAKTFDCTIESSHLYELNDSGEYAYKLYQANNTYDIIGLFEINLPATWEVYTDVNCQNKLDGYVLDLVEGNNYHYIKITDGHYSKVHTVKTELVQKFEINYHIVNDEVITVQYPLDNNLREFLNYPVNGYNFEGWYEEDGDELTFVYVYAGFINVFGKFSPIEYNITYNNVPEGITNPNNINYNIETEIELINLEKPGYTFAGWFTDVNYSQKLTKIEKGSTEDIILFAKFDVNTYKVNVGGSSFDVTYDQAYTLDVLNANGKTFLGYYTEENGNGTQLTDETGKSFAIYNIANDITAYPHYSLNQYNINYHLDDETCPSNRTYTVEDVIELPQLTKDGHTFTGWYKSEDLSGDKYTVVSNSYEDINLYAKFNPNTYNVTINGNIYDVVYGKNFQLVYETVDGMNFEGYYTGENGTGQKITNNDGSSNGGYSLTDNVTLYPYYTLATYTITYDDKGASLVDSEYVYQTEYNMNSEEIVLPELTIENGEFLGWYDNADYEGEAVTSIPSGSFGNKAFYAKFEYSSFDINYTDYNRIVITYNTLGGNNISSTTMSVGSRLSRPTWDPEKEGYLFTGWYKDIDCTDLFLFDENLYADTTLYAGWYQPTYTCENTNNLLDATKHSASYNYIEQALSLNTNYKWTFVAPQTKTENDSTAYGIHYKQSYGTQIYFQYNISLYNETQQVEVFSDLYDGTSYKAQHFTANAGDILTLTITYPRSHPSVSSSEATFYFSNFSHPYETTTFENSVTVNYGETFTLPVREVSKATFVGYFTEKDGQGIKVTDETGASLEAFTFTEPLLVYPYYECERYTILYDLGGVEVPDTVEFITEYDVTTPKRALPNLSISGYTFNGWYANEEFTGDKLTMIPQEAQEDLVFYADIQANEYNLYLSYASSATVTFIPQDNGYNKDKTVTLNSKNPSLTIPTFYARTGYMLAGWYTEAECINQYKFNKPILEDLTLYAKWVRIDSFTTITKINPANYAYIPNSSSQNALYQPSVTKSYPVIIAFVLNQDYTEENPFSLHYANTWGGTSVDYAYYLEVHNKTTETCIQEQILVSYQSAYSSIKITGNEGDIVYVEMSAYNQKTCPSIAFSGYVQSPSSTAAVGYYTKVNYYSTYTVEVHQYPGLRLDGFYTQANGEGELYIDNLGNPLNKHYDNLGDVTVYAYLTEDPYQIKYETDGGEVDASEYQYQETYRYDSEDIVLPVLEKTGYEFNGWYLNENFEGDPIEVIKTGTCGDLYLYAKFTALEFAITSPIADSAVVTFDPQNGGEVFTVEISGDEILAVPEEPTYEDYLFLGWFKDSECTERYNFKEIVYPGLKLYGGWIAQNKLVNYYGYVKIDPTGHDSEETDFDLTVYSSGTSAYSFILNQNTDENPLALRSAFTMNVSQPSNYSYFITIYNETTKETLLDNYQQYYYWGNDYSSFDIKGSIGDIITIILRPYKYGSNMSTYFDGYVSLESTSSLTLDKTVTYDKEFTLDCPCLEGKKFVGYYTEENGQGTKITDEFGKSIVPFTYTNDLVVYAHYEEIAE